MSDQLAQAKLRVSRCPRIDISGSYEIRFPFNEVAKEAGYDIDTERALFVASGEDPTEYFLEKDSDARLQRMIEVMKSRRRWSEAIEEDDKLTSRPRRPMAAHLISSLFYDYNKQYRWCFESWRFSVHEPIECKGSKQEQEQKIATKPEAPSAVDGRPKEILEHCRSAFKKSPMEETLMTLVAHVKIPDKRKTVAVMYQGDPFPTVAVMGGWHEKGPDESNIQLAGRSWTDEVFQLCKLIEYRLPQDGYD
ncbi:hypothetical protein HYFRA_00000708 [Hymenoscyphus fraxineus]|uniref:Single-strand DNA deaminase toxin A-like C-terminal domain-containing protein n=1 Tax=Hymenoscyphus fraxineus TaxID=746836 RepID=A0A9N9KSP2_9HELO|nr:hypothetical protein HYFRA_00000708 [Hymenoscyphus fraxineus]